MSTTTYKLPQKSIDYLQNLITLNIDSRDGFREAVENMDKGSGTEMSRMLSQIAVERDRQAMELQTLVAGNHEEPQQTGSMAAAAHRAWMDLRATLGGGNKAMLDEVVRGEEHVKSQYDAAIQDLGSCECVPTLRRHVAAINSSLAKVHAFQGKCDGK
jgi:uncharacterized protein (TIGR02284 family)